MNLFYYQIVICQVVLIFGNVPNISIFRERWKPKPDIILNDLKFGHNVIGNNLRLECQLRLYANYGSIEWNITEHVTQKTITLRENTDSIYAQTSTLVVEHPPQLGSYNCYVKVPVENLIMTSNQLQITLYDLEENVLEINENDIFFNAADATITINFKAHPDVTVAWIDHRGKIIDSSSNTTIFQLTAIIDNYYNYKAKLSFQSITEDDLGTYTVFIGSSTRKSQINIKIDLDEQVEISLTILSLDEDEMVATYECKAAGNPKPNITWIFQPCSVFEFVVDNNTKFSVEPLILNESYFEDRGLQVISHVSLNLSESGILKCVTRNNQAQEYAFYVKNGFDVITNVSSQHGNKVYVGYTQIVNLFCFVSFYKYLNINLWYLNNLLIKNKGINTYTFKYPKYLLQKAVHISFDLHDEFQLGNYSCVSVTKTGKIESKTVEILFKSMPTLLPKIYLQDLNGGHTIVGQDIRLMCNITFHEHVQIIWKFIKTKRNGFLEKSATPLPLEKYVDRLKFKQKDIRLVDSNIHITTSYLTISEANISETGYYDCGMAVSNAYFDESIWVRIYDVGGSHISFHKNSNFDKQNLKIEIFMTAHPHPTIQWFDNNRNEILPDSSNKSNFLISFQQILNKTKTDTNYEVNLNFKNLTLENFGYYTIVVKNEYEEANYSIEVNVTGVPSTKIYNETFSKEKALLKCSAIGSPTPTIQWYFKKCTTLKSCVEFTDESRNIYIPKNESWNETKGFQHISYISLNLSERGVLRCQSRNVFGKDSAYEPILGFGNEFEIFADGHSLNQPIELVGPAIKMNVTCATSSYNYTEEFGVFIENLKVNAPVKYPNNPEESETTIESHYILSNFLIATLFVNSPGDSFYSCTVLNKNGSLKTKSLHVRSKLTATITFSKTNMQNESVYIDMDSKLVLYCYIDGFPTPTVKWFKNNQVVLSSHGIKFSNNGQVLEIWKTSPDDQGTYMCEASNMYVKSVRYTTVFLVINYTWVYVLTLLLLLALLFVATLAFIKFRHEKTLRENLELVGLSYFGKNPLDRINPKLGIENQAILLPYDTNWEIPMEKIIIGKQLGSGAFGVTFQANIVDYFSDHLNKTVAVKSVNALSGLESIKALASEIKIMSHLGKHVNVVNFLGACTKHVTKRELYMVLEFCPFGDILAYLRHRNKSFIDQKDHDSDSFKWNNDDHGSSFETKNIITSRDLVLWSFQIARGMDYLGFRRIVHGDLAARNVLLTDNNVVKLCDFGLAEHLYNYNNYVKKTEGRFPIKWMAVEAIERGVFSIQSDVWSFGIVLWEIFSLGKTPYIGISPDQTFCKLLIDGYRMEKPEAATADIYKFMLDCWNINPVLRPSFASLEDQIGLLLEEPVKDRYIDMNNEYILMNKHQVEDYLTIFLSPTYENIVSQLSENPAQ